MHELDTLIEKLFIPQSQEDFLRSLCNLSCQVVGAVGVAILLNNHGNVHTLAYSHDFLENKNEDESTNASQEEIESQNNKQEEKPLWLLDLAKAYSQRLSNSVHTMQISAGSNPAFAIFVPLVYEGEGFLSICAYLHGGRSIRLKTACDMLRIMQTFYRFFHERAEKLELSLGSKNPQLLALTNVLNILSTVQDTNKFFAACTSLCTEIATTFSCRRVCLGAVKGNFVKIVAIDQMDSFEKGTHSIRLAEDAMQEAFDQEQSICISQANNFTAEQHLVVRATKELVQNTKCKTALSIPASERKEIKFVLLILSDDSYMTNEFINSINLILKLSLTHLYHLYLAEELPIKKAWHYLLHKAEDIFGKRKTVLKLVSFFLAIFLLATLIIRGDLTISAPIVVEGVNSYTLTAPIDGYLAEVYVSPGDRVHIGDSLGMLDQSEINLEIAALEAQFEIYQNQTNQFLQEGKEVEANIASLEAKKTKANLEWAKERLIHTKLNSSVEGFVVSEDMKPRLGQPVQRGQDLFEITDTDAMRIVAHIDESDINDINKAMANKSIEAEFTLTAYPNLTIPFEIERVHPYSTIYENKNGFETRGKISPDLAEAISLRPGMEGYAKIYAGRAPLIYLWTRKIINRVRLVLWRWF